MANQKVPFNKPYMTGQGLYHIAEANICNMSVLSASLPISTLPDVLRFGERGVLADSAQQVAEPKFSL